MNIYGTVRPLSGRGCISHECTWADQLSCENSIPYLLEQELSLSVTSGTMVQCHQRGPPHFSQGETEIQESEKSFFWCWQKQFLALKMFLPFVAHWSPGWTVAPPSLSSWTSCTQQNQASESAESVKIFLCALQVPWCSFPATIFIISIGDTFNRSYSCTLNYNDACSSDWFLLLLGKNLDGKEENTKLQEWLSMTLVQYSFRDVCMDLT